MAQGRVPGLNGASSPRIANAQRQDQLALLGGLLALAVFAWLVTRRGYRLVWTAAGLVAYALVELVRSLDPPFLAWGEAGRHITAGVIAAAAAYQLTSAKETCLAACRDPMLLAERWRHRRGGALEVGLRYGAWCLGCCWALMAALFAMGVMSLGWMALIAAFIGAERLLAGPNAPRRAVALSLLVLGLGVAF